MLLLEWQPGFLLDYHRVCNYEDRNHLVHWSDFYLDNARPDGCSSYCKPCKAEYDALKYLRYKQDWSAFFTSIHWDHCHVCGYDACFEGLCAHHLIPELKTMNVGHFTSSHSCSAKNQARLLKELETCASLCLLCHAEIHADCGPFTKEIETESTTPSTDRVHHRPLLRYPAPYGYRIEGDRRVAQSKGLVQRLRVSLCNTARWFFRSWSSKD